MLSLLYSVIIILFCISILLVFLSHKNEDKRIAKGICWISIVYSINILTFAFYSPHKLGLSIGFEIFLYYALAVIGTILYFTAFIKSNNVTSKLEDSKYKRSKTITIVFILLLIPQLVLINEYLKETYYINNSKIVIEYYDQGNGSIGDSTHMAFAFDEKNSKEVQIGVNSDMGRFIYKEYDIITPKYYWFYGKNESVYGDILQILDDYVIADNIYYKTESKPIDEDLAKEFIDIYEKNYNGNIQSFSVKYLEECDCYILDLFDYIYLYEGNNFIGKIEKSRHCTGDLQNVYLIK